jgi:hypothetical protein
MAFTFPPGPHIYHSLATKGIDENGNPIIVDKTPPGLFLTGTRDKKHPTNEKINEPGLKHVGTSILGNKDPKSDPNPGKNPDSKCDNCSLEDGIASIPCQIQKAACEASTAVHNNLNIKIPTTWILAGVGGALLIGILLITKK